MLVMPLPSCKVVRFCSFDFLVAAVLCQSIFICLSRVLRYLYVRHDCERYHSTLNNCTQILWKITLAVFTLSTDQKNAVMLMLMILIYLQSTNGHRTDIASDIFWEHCGHASPCSIFYKWFIYNQDGRTTQTHTQRAAREDRAAALSGHA